MTTDGGVRATSWHGVPTDAAPGRLVNGALALTEPLQASGGGAFAALGAPPLTLITYAQPVSDGGVAIAFRQHIGATQALRTGVYSKTLTFGLSTTAQLVTGRFQGRTVGVAHVLADLEQQPAGPVGEPAGEGRVDDRRRSSAVEAVALAVTLAQDARRHLCLLAH